ncbi:MAG: sulfurtransferase, partial [Promethearchaeota archaeon]
IDIWLNSIALAVFSDKKVGILKGDEYVLVKPKKLLIATGAREKSLIFHGNILPGVYGAGAFQTLVNRDLIRPCKKLFIIGGGNVGLIAGYHALQADIEVIGLIEAMSKCGGYKVHKDKLERSGVPIYTSHTIISANGKDKVESITIVKIDENFEPIKDTEKTFEVDTILIAVGLNPVDEFFHKAEEFKIDVWSAGDAQEIAEASAAMFSGRIQAMKIAQSLDLDIEPIPPDSFNLLNTLKKPGGKIIKRDLPKEEDGIFPVFHCYQEIPCNPCTAVCPINQIKTYNDDILKLPYFKAEKNCLGCGRCVAVCPGLAVTLVDFRNNPINPMVTIPYEMNRDRLNKGDIVSIIDEDNNSIGKFPIEQIRVLKDFPNTQLISVKIPKKNAKKAASIKIQKNANRESLFDYKGEKIPDEDIVCRCERVTAREIRKWIRNGITDINQLKAITRAGMGACGAKTCARLIERLMQEEGVPIEQITKGTKRPLFVEVPLGIFAGAKDPKSGD